MSPEQYRKSLDQLGLTQVQAARLFDVDDRTSRRWANGERRISPPAVRFIRYLLATNKTGERAMHVLGVKVD